MLQIKMLLNDVMKTTWMDCCFDFESGIDDLLQFSNCSQNPLRPTTKRRPLAVARPFIINVRFCLIWFYTH